MIAIEVLAEFGDLVIFIIITTVILRGGWFYVSDVVYVWGYTRWPTASLASPSATAS